MRRQSAFRRVWGEVPRMIEFCLWATVFILVAFVVVVVPLLGIVSLVAWVLH